MTTNIFRGTAALALALTTSVVLAAVALGATGGKPGAQRFTLASRTIGGVDQPIRVTAAGPISGAGTVSAPKHASRHDHLTLHFSKGSLLLDVRETFFAVHPNFSACTAKAVGRGTFRITRGTGSFRGTTGAGTFNRITAMIGAHNPNGACAGKSTPPKAVYTTSAFVGTAKVPAG
jgi:hypothetical protein